MRLSCFRRADEDCQDTNDPAYADLPAQAVPLADVRAGVGVLCRIGSIHEYPPYHGPQGYCHDNYGQEENGRPQFSRSAANRTVEPQRTREPETRQAVTSSFTSRPSNLYRVSDVQRYSHGAAGSSHSSLSVGAIVQHDRFGVGEVMSTEGTGENAKATIKFQNAGVKTLLLKFAKLKTIG